MFTHIEAKPATQEKILEHKTIIALNDMQLDQLTKKKAELEARIQSIKSNRHAHNLALDKLTEKEEKEEFTYDVNLWLRIKKHVEDLLLRYNEFTLAQIWEQLKPLVEGHRYEKLYKWIFMYQYVIRDPQQTDCRWLVDYIDKQNISPKQTFSSQKALSLAAERCLNAALSTLDEKDYQPRASFNYLNFASRPYELSGKRLEICKELSSLQVSYEREFHREFKTNRANQYYKKVYQEQGFYRYGAFSWTTYKLNDNDKEIQLLYLKIALIYHLYERLSDENALPTFDAIKTEINLYYSIQKSNNKIISPIDSKIEKLLKKICAPQDEKSKPKEKELKIPEPSRQHKKDQLTTPLLSSSMSVLQNDSNINSTEAADEEITEPGMPKKKFK